MSTRRTAQREFLTRPQFLINQIMAYVLGYEQERYGFELNAFVALSDHKHAVGADRSNNADHSELANIERDYNSYVARAINRVYNRSGAVWEHGGTESFNFVETPTPEDRIRSMVYSAHNPVEGELVNDYRKWPGVLLLPGPSGLRRIVVRRPPIFFSESAPEFVTITLTAPEVPDKTPREVMNDVFERLNRLRDEVRTRVELAGRTFLGAKRILKTNPRTRATKPESKFHKRPRYSTHDQTQRITMKARDHLWLETYEERLARSRTNGPKPTFPFGTYKMVEYYDYPCHATPD